MSKLDSLHSMPLALQATTDVYDTMYQELVAWQPAPAHRRRYASSRKYYATTMALLECFVDRVAHIASPSGPDKTAVAPRANPADGISKRYSADIPHFINVVGLLSDAYTYNEHIEIFRQTCRELGILDRAFTWRRLLDGAYPNAFSQNPEVIIFQLICRIREQCQEVNIRVAVAKRRNEAEERYLDYCDYIDAWFDEVPRLVFIRLDLGYACDEDNPIQMKQAVADLARFLRNRHHNQLFTGWVGYIAKLECGVTKGLHWHLLIFFNGRERDGDSHVHLAKKLGEYWCSRIAGKRGRYWNCNADYNEFLSLNRCGIGPIHWADTDLRKNLLNHVLPYLTKTSQFVRPKSDDDSRTMRRGQYPPEREGLKRGRRRQHQD